MRIRGSHLVDERGRTLLLRGVNLGGSSKVPTVPDGATHRPGSREDHRRVSFVGRPFPLSEAEEHLRRLESWGFTAARLIVTWEAIEHEGPGLYDEAYLDYLAAVAQAAGRHGISLIVDPHQDMWSRFSGGDGAPGWTLEAAGLDLAHLDDTGAAVTHARHGDPVPRVLWVTNGGKLAAATMFTLFFGGSDFAPRTRVDGRSIQDLLQECYVNAFCRVMEKLKPFQNVIGCGTMNEPLCGYIGWADLTVPHGQLTLGDGPTPFQGMLLGAGISQEVGIWAMRTAAIRRSGARMLNAQAVRAWLPGRDCVWRENGVWDLGPDGAPVLLRPDHFANVRGRGVEFTQDYLKPFAEKLAAAVRRVNPEALIFLEAEAGAPPPRWDAARLPGVVFAPHWYDDLTLVKNRYYAFAGLDSPAGYRLVLGRRAVARSFCGQLRALARHAQERMDGAPTVLAEFGIPFSLRRAAVQARALDRSYRAIECAMLGHIIWNYTADNTRAQGDNWNGEDLSVFSRDSRTDSSSLDSGGRALEALLRPWPRAVAGEPLSFSFDRGRRVFRLEFRHDPGVGGPSEIYVPRFQYPQGCQVEVSDGTFELRPQEQILLYHHDPARPLHRVLVHPSRARRER